MFKPFTGIGTKNFMFGILGLGPGTTNFDDFNDPQPSFMWTLKNQSLIPSLSYGYYAGASYDKTPASLVLGGYDTSQIDVRKAPSVDFKIDRSYALPVAIQVIQASGTLNGVVSLLPEGIIAKIDSTIPEIWLPPAACEKFERSFGKAIFWAPPSQVDFTELTSPKDSKWTMQQDDISSTKRFMQD